MRFLSLHQFEWEILESDNMNSPSDCKLCRICVINVITFYIYFFTQKYITLHATIKLYKWQISAEWKFKMPGLVTTFVADNCCRSNLCLSFYNRWSVYFSIEYSTKKLFYYSPNHHGIFNHEVIQGEPETIFRIEGEHCKRVYVRQVHIKYHKSIC